MAIALMAMLAVQLVNVSPASARAGDRDPSFGRQGIVTTGFGSGGAAGFIALDGDRLLVGGVLGKGFLLARYTPDGRLDQSFGEEGRTVTRFPPGYARLLAVALVDGGIVAAGVITEGDPQIAIAHYHSDGSLDPTFGDGGTLLVPVVGSMGYPSTATIAADGGILVGGVDDANVDFSLMRLRPDGTPDPLFGDGGSVRTDFGRHHDRVDYVTLTADGRIVALGTSMDISSSTETYALSRYLPDGSLDSTFSRDGKLTGGFGGSNMITGGLAVSADGRVLIAGGSAGIGVARYLPDGHPDPSFDGDGTMTLGPAVPGRLEDIVLDDEDRIVGAGESSAGPMLLRLESDGDLDGSFGPNHDGVVRAAFPRQVPAGVPPPSGSLASVVVRPDGTLVGAGHELLTEGSRVGLMAVEADGTADTGFGPRGDGIVVTPFYLPSSEKAAAALTQPDGKVVVAVSVDGLSTSGLFAVARYLPDGTLDPSFGEEGDGRAIVDLPGRARVVGIALLADGTLIVGGGMDGPDSGYVYDEIAIAHLLPDGRVDHSFGPDGRGFVVTDFGDDVTAEAMAVQGSSLLIAGSVNQGTDVDMAVARYSLDGRLDTAFGGTTDGLVTVEFGHFDVAESIAVRSEGGFVLAGQTYSDMTHSDVAVARFRVDGSPDPAFSGDGRQTTDVRAAGRADGARAVAIDPDGNVIVTGFSCGRLGEPACYFFTENPPATLLVARYRPDGTLDPTFGHDGTVLTDLGGPSEGAEAILLRPRGRILVGGTAVLGQFEARFALARYTSAGDPDPAFGSNGKILTGITNSYGQTYDQIAALAPGADGTAIAAGSAARAGFAVVRYFNSSGMGIGPRTVSIGNASVTEGDAGPIDATVRVRLSAPTSQPVEVAYATCCGTAEADSPPLDYTPAEGTLEFAPGETVKSVTVKVQGDTRREPNETFLVSITRTSGTPEEIDVADGTGRVTIKNDD